MKEQLTKHWEIISIATWAVISRLFFISQYTWHNDAADFIYSGFKLATTGVYLKAHAPDYPAWNIVLAGAIKFISLLNNFISPVVVANTTSAIFGIGSIIIFYFLAKSFWSNSKIAFIATILFSLNPTLWLINQLALSESAAILFLVSSLYLYQKFLNDKKSYLIFSSAFIFGLSLLTRFSGIILLPILVGYHWLTDISFKKNQFTP